MRKKIFVFTGTAVLLINLAGLASACGCGGGCAGGCGNGSGADSCQETGQVYGGRSAVTSGAEMPAVAAVSAGNTVCPVMGKKINNETKAMYEYEGKVYNLCCAGCIDEFKKDPRKYLERMKS